MSKVICMILLSVLSFLALCYTRPNIFIIGLIVLAFTIFQRTSLYFKLKVYITMYVTILKFRLKGINMKVEDITFYEKEEK